MISRTKKRIDDSKIGVLSFVVSQIAILLLCIVQQDLFVARFCGLLWFSVFSAVVATAVHAGVVCIRENIANAGWDAFYFSLRS